MNREVTEEELHTRARGIAEELGLSSEEEAFGALDRGELDGIWLEVELKLVRHLLGHSARVNEATDRVIGQHQGILEELAKR